MHDFVVEKIIMQSGANLKTLGDFRRVSSQWARCVDSIIERLFLTTFGISGVKSFAVSRNVVENHMRQWSVWGRMRAWKKIADVPMSLSFRTETLHQQSENATRVTNPSLLIYA
jgi:hypothetical protein